MSASAIHPRAKTQGHPPTPKHRHPPLERLGFSSFAHRTKPITTTSLAHPNAAKPPAISKSVPSESSTSRSTSARAEPSEDKTPEPQPKDDLDSATRTVAQLAPPPQAVAMTPSKTPDTIAPHARVSMEDLLPQLVRRIAWAGDKRRGTVQLELGAGRHEGTIVTVHADEGRVRIELTGRDAVDVDALRGRIDARLRRHGLDVESVS